MHYTSIENIHKAIDPLFFDTLQAELNNALAYKNEKQRTQALLTFQEKLAGLIFFDPACGSGNFLTETYLSLRRLENEALRELAKGKGQFLINPIKVSINQFYGIEINDFAVTVAKTALWIAESQMVAKTEEIINHDIDFLPLKSYSNIHEGNALRMDRNEVIPNTKLNYIMGNPPFIGARLMDTDQKSDIAKIFEGRNKFGNLDYVACWYKKASDYMKGTAVQASLVSTNSICQGEQVALLRKPLFEDGVIINFAYKTFRRDNEASDKAHVHCIIVGF